ncbi:MAG: Gfo/Idh/MocA family oxidoreductase [Thermoleophilia bacterium]
MRVGVIGLGVGEQHARAFAGCAGASLAAVCDPDPTRLAEVSARFPGVRATTDPRAVLADPAIDLVSIASPDDAHFDQALTGLREGKHVFVEKPLCRSLGELAALETTWRARRRQLLASNLVLRAAPLYRWLREAVRAGELGQVYAFDGDYLYGRLHKLTDGWRGAIEGYSVMLGGGIHLVDLMLWVTGERPRAVSASGSGIATEGSHFRGADFVAATFTFPSGLVGRVTANFGCVHPHHHVVRVFGTEASVVHDDQGPRLFRTRDPRERPVPLDLDPLPASKGALVPQLVGAVRDVQDTSDWTHHELDVVACCLAADRALAEGGPVGIDYRD